MFDFSPIQILIVLAIALLVLGPKRLPDMGRSLGRGLRDFKSSLSGDEHHDDDAPHSPAEALAARQAVPAPTPELAEAEAADERPLEPVR